MHEKQEVTRSDNSPNWLKDSTIYTFANGSRIFCHVEGAMTHGDAKATVTEATVTEREDINLLSQLSTSSSSFNDFFIDRFISTITKKFLMWRFVI